MYKIKPQNIILLVFLVIVNSAMAQEIYVGSGFSTATFEDYVNSSGENTLDDSGYSKSKQPLFESGGRFDIYKDRLQVDVGAHYNKYRIKTSFYSGNLRIPMTYNLSYVGLKAGLNLDVIRYKKINFQFHVHLYNDWLVQGTNTYENEIIDLYEEQTIDNSVLGFHRGLGLEYQVTKKFSCYLRYNVASNFKEANEDSTSGEEYILKAKSIRIGVSFNIGTEKEKETEKETEKESEKKE